MLNVAVWRTVALNNAEDSNADFLCFSVKTDMGAEGAVSRLYIANANKKDSGNYSCALTDVAATTVSVHVLNGQYAVIFVTSFYCAHIYSKTRATFFLLNSHCSFWLSLWKYLAFIRIYYFYKIFWRLRIIFQFFLSSFIYSLFLWNDLQFHQKNSSFR